MIREKLSSVSRLHAIWSIQGLPVAIRKAYDVAFSRIGFASGNDIVPYLRREAGFRKYRTYIDIRAAKGNTLLPVSYMFNQCIAIEPALAH